MQMINFNDPLNRWTLDTVKMICDKVRDYALAHSLNPALVELVDVEDNTRTDSVNQRYDITIRYFARTTLIQHKLLILKGEIMDGAEFHKRYNEFYGKERTA